MRATFSSSRPSLGGRGSLIKHAFQFDFTMHVLLFDIDGTLISSGGAGSKALFRAVQNEFNLSDIVEFGLHGCTDRGIARDLFEQHSIEDNEENWSRFRDAYLLELPDSLKKIKGRVLPGVVELLSELSARDNCLLGLLTGNLQAGAHHKLTHYDLHHHFSFGGFGDLHPERDDVARTAFESAAAIVADLTPDRVWVIGDTPNDVRCARAINANAIVVTTGIYKDDDFADTPPDHLWNGLTDIELWNDLLV